MNNKEYLKQRLNTIFSAAQNAVNVNEEAINNPDKGYAYSAGYSSAVLQGIANEVQQMIAEVSTETFTIF